MKEQAFFNWSGGKDSALALYKVKHSNQYNIQCLLTNINSVYDRVSMHGVRRSLMEAQVASIGLPLVTAELPEEPSMHDYETIMANKLNTLKASGCSKAIFGDIFLEDLKIYREQKLKEVGIECVFPLWKMDTTILIKEFINLGFKAVIVCVNETYLDKSFCGRLIDASFVNDLPSNVDVCGENGEFHSFVFDGPIFKKPVQFKKGEVVYKQYEAPETNETNAQTKYGFWFCDLLPADLLKLKATDA